MTIELAQVVTPFGVVAAAIVTAFIARIPTWTSTKTERREDFKSAEEFLEKLTDQTSNFVVEKWYEAISGNDKAEAEEVRFMLTMRWAAKVFGLRRNAKNYAEFTKADAGRPAGYRYKGLYKYAVYRALYNVGNLVAYIGLFAVPALPIILGKHDIFDREWGAIATYILMSISTFCMAITRIKALAGLSCAGQLVAMSDQILSPAPLQAKTLALVPDRREDQDAA